MLAQKFISSVKIKGEISLIFFNEIFSHSIIKRPPQNDFKVQGGKVEVFDASSQQISFAQKCLFAAKKCVFKRNFDNKLSILIARVDILFSNDGKQLYLNELEVLDPELFLRKYSNSVSLYFEQILKALN